MRVSRNSLGLTQEEFGKKTGLSRANVFDIEKGRQLVPAHEFSLTKLNQTMESSIFMGVELTIRSKEDIDLLLLLDQESLCSLLSSKKHTILNKFKKRIGDRKIDFSILSSEQALKDPFYKDVITKSIVLKKW